MSITISDIAERAGVSISTVSFVMNKQRRPIPISARTREKVLAAARDLNYLPSFAARSLAKGKTFSLGLICGDIHNPHMSEYATIALREAEARGYHLLISLTEWKGVDRDLACLDSLLQRGVDGIIFMSFAIQPGTKQYDYVLKEKFPLVLANYSIPKLSKVGSDWRKGFEEALDHLRNKGHRKIGITVFNKMSSVELRNHPKFSVFLDLCSRKGMEPEFLTPETPLSSLSLGFEEARSLAGNLANSRQLPGAIFVTSDYLCMGFINGLRDAGLEVPRDIQVVGMDGTEMGRNFHPSLTSIAQDRRQLAVSAVEMLLQMMDDRDFQPREVLIPTKLIVRDSA
jgi:LacI family transcriptional regulator